MMPNARLDKATASPTLPDRLNPLRMKPRNAISSQIAGAAANAMITSQSGCESLDISFKASASPGGGFGKNHCRLTASSIVSGCKANGSNKAHPSRLNPGHRRANVLRRLVVSITPIIRAGVAIKAIC